MTSVGKPNLVTSIITDERLGQAFYNTVPPLEEQVYDPRIQDIAHKRAIGLIAALGNFGKPRLFDHPADARWSYYFARDENPELLEGNRPTYEMAFILTAAAVLEGDSELLANLENANREAREGENA